jgi:hypothetical protein
VLLGSLMAVASAHASTFSSGPGNCASCHGQPPQLLSQSALYGIIIPLVDDGRYDQSCKSTVAGGVANCALRQRISGNPSMAGVAGNFSEDELEAIRLYLIQVRDAVATHTAPSFSSTVVGASDTTSFSVQISNFRGLPIGYALSLVGGDAADFSIVSQSPAPASCPAGQVPATASAAAKVCTVSVTVKFEPSAAGTRSTSLHAQLTASSASDPNPASVDVALSGVATAAPQGLVALSQASLAFPATPLAGSSPLSITLGNSGTAALNLGAFTLGGANPGDFVRSGTCNAGTVLAVGAQCTLTVTFQPAVLGARSASLTITSDASNSPTTIPLTGTGVAMLAPQASLLPSTFDFGMQTVGGIYPKRSFTLKNVGTANMSVSVAAVPGGAFANVSAAPCPTVLLPGASCVIDIAFTPIAAATNYTGTLSVTTNAPGSPHTVTLVGRGTAATVPVLAWLPVVGQLDFGLITAGAVSAVQSAHLVNNGPGGVTLSLVNAVGADASVFSFSGGTCVAGLTLFEGDTCRVDVQFAPAFAGPRTATVQVASGASPPPPLTLAGTGLGGPGPDLSLSATALTFDDTRVGARSLPMEVILSSTGGAVRVTALELSGPYALRNKTCPAAPFTLIAGTECSITVAFAPTLEGGSSGLLRVTSDALPPVRELALSGQGQSPLEVSSGGCSMSSGDSLADPTLWSLTVLAVAALFHRRRVRAAQRRGERSGRRLP